MQSRNLLFALSLLFVCLGAFVASAAQFDVRKFPELAVLDLENIKYPLEPSAKAIVQAAGLATGQPKVDTEHPFVVTPFGIFGRDCYHETESGAKVEETANHDLLVSFENGTSYIYPSSKYGCHERFEPNNLPKRQHQRRLNSSEVAPAPMADGWLDNAWYFSSGEIGSFTSVYQVPGTPPNPNGQILFYFIGLECSNSDLAILQPVLQYNNGISGWSFSSWYCCPSGTPNQATPIQGFGPGSLITGYMTPNSNTPGADFTVKSCNGGSCSTLNCPSQGRVWTEADITLETYSVGSCNQMANGPMTFSNMAMSDINGNTINQPGWTQITGGTECGGNINVNYPTATITHNPNSL